VIIEAIGLSLPTWEVSNEEVIDLIRHHSKPVFQGNLERTLRKIDIVLKKTGAETRFWLNKQNNEKPIGHAKKAVIEALKKANLKKDDIDLLVYVGVGRGFVEPGNSYFMAHALGMTKVRCIDIIDACMSWTAAMHMIDSFFKTESYKSAMIVNAEFIMHDGPLFKNFTLKNDKGLEYILPSFTVGEAATCTILFPNDPRNFKFKFTSRSDLADLCMIPLPKFKEYCEMTKRISNNEEMYFTSFGSKMHELGTIELKKLFKTLSIEREDIDIVFTHASSKTEWQKCADSVGIGNKIYHIYQKTGNLISASIPAAIYMAQKENKLKTNNKILCWVGSAGMSFSTMSFTL